MIGRGFENAAFAPLVETNFAHMKPAAIVLGASLVVNAALVAGVVWRAAGPGAHDAKDASGITEEESAGAIRLATSASKSDPAVAARARAPDMSGAWQALSKGEPKELIERLRGAGFPPHVLRTVASQLVREQLADRQLALLANLPTREYWTSSFNSYWVNPEFRAGQHEIALERRERLKELLGADYESPDLSRDSLANLARRYGPLDAEKIGQLHELEGDYRDLRMQLVTGEGTGVRLPADNESLKLLDAELRRDLETLLTPAELEEYDRRNSPTTENLRRRLSDVDLTEDEYHALYQLQKSFDDRYTANYMGGVVLPNTPEFARERRAAQEELNASIADLIGPERAAEFERSGDFSYQRLKRVVQYLELPSEAAVVAHDLHGETQRRAAAIRSDRSLSAEQRTAQLTALREDVSGRLSTVLTQEGLEVFKLNGGQWLDQLATIPGAPRG